MTASAHGLRAVTDCPAEGRAPLGRALAIGLLAVAALSLFVPYADLYLRGSRIAYSHLPVGAVVVLLSLLAGNAAMRLVSRREVLGRRGIALVFCMVLAVASIPSSGYVAFLFSVVISPAHLATPANKYEELFLHHVPTWFAPTDPVALRGFWDGLGPGTPIPWSAWAGPLAAWTALAAALFLTLSALSVALRRRWSDHEKLVFPLVQIPLEMMPEGGAGGGGGAPLFRSWMLWAAAAVVLGVHSLNGLSFYYPEAPRIRLAALPIGAALTSRPWSALRGERIYIIASVIGVSYLLTTEVSLSFWAFHFIWAAQRLAFAILGFEGGGGTAIPANLFGRYEEIGAFVALAGWMAHTIYRQLRREPDAETRRALGVAAFGMGLCCAWCVIAGMSLMAAAGFFLVFLVISTVLSRAVSAGGVLFVECSFLPQDVVVRTVGYQGVGARNLTVWAFPEMIFMFEQQTIMMPYVLGSCKLAGDARVPRGWLYSGIGLAFAVSLGCSYYSALRTIYAHGALSLDEWYMQGGASWPLRRLAGTINGEIPRDWTAIKVMVAGAGMMSALMWMHRGFAWWRLHPLGFVMGSTYTMNVMWFSIFVGWLAKSLVVKYGGFPAYRRSRPLLIGLVVGEFLAAFLWLLIDGHYGVIGHNIFPGF